MSHSQQQRQEETNMKNLHLTVAAIIEDRNRFLVVEETVQGELVINQPAGHVEPGETLQDAVARETLEETAWHFSPEALIGLYLWEHPDNGERFLRAVFIGKHFDHNPKQPLDTGIERALWLSREELERRTPQLRSPMVLRGIDDYLAGKRYPLDVVAQLGVNDLLEKAAKVVN
jgi:8-oxo-dGTP pyrophosphatase MutT (NUDIX family)